MLLLDQNLCRILLCGHVWKLDKQWLGRQEKTSLFWGAKFESAGSSKQQHIYTEYKYVKSGGSKSLSLYL